MLYLQESNICFYVAIIREGCVWHQYHLVLCSNGTNRNKNFPPFFIINCMTISDYRNPYTACNFKLHARFYLKLRGVDFYVVR